MKDWKPHIRLKSRKWKKNLKFQQKDYKLRKRIQGSTSDNDVLIKYNKIKEEQVQKDNRNLKN